MGIWGKLFGKKEEPKEELLQTEEKIEPQNFKPEREFNNNICGICKFPIGQERYKKAGVNFLHKKCFRKAKRMVLNGR